MFIYVNTIIHDALMLTITALDQLVNGEINMN